MLFNRNAERLVIEMLNLAIVVKTCNAKEENQALAKELGRICRLFQLEPGFCYSKKVLEASFTFGSL